MQRIGGEQDTAQPEFLDQSLDGWDLCRGVANLLVRQDQGFLTGKGTQHVRRRLVVQMVKAALERLAIKRNDPWSGGWRYRAQGLSMLTKGGLQRGGIERLE